MLGKLIMGAVGMVCVFFAAVNFFASLSMTGGQPYLYAQGEYVPSTYYEFTNPRVTSKRRLCCIYIANIKGSEDEIAFLPINESFIVENVGRSLGVRLLNYKNGGAPGYRIAIQEYIDGNVVSDLKTNGYKEAWDEKKGNAVIVSIRVLIGSFVCFIFFVVIGHWTDKHFKQKMSKPESDKHNQ